MERILLCIWRCPWEVLSILRRCRATCPRDDQMAADSLFCFILRRHSHLGDQYRCLWCGSGRFTPRDVVYILQDEVNSKQFANMRYMNSGFISAHHSIEVQSPVLSFISSFNFSSCIAISPVCCQVFHFLWDPVIIWRLCARITATIWSQSIHPSKAIGSHLHG